MNLLHIGLVPKSGLLLPTLTTIVAGFLAPEKNYIHLIEKIKIWGLKQYPVVILHIIYTERIVDLIL